MGFSDEAVDKVKEAGISRSQMYKQACNCIVVDVLYYIFRNLLTRYNQHVIIKWKGPQK